MDIDKEIMMTNKDYDAIKDRMMDLVRNGSPDVAWTSAKAITDITVELEELKMRQETHAQQMQDSLYHQSEGEEKCSCKDAPSPAGCAVSQYCNNELIHKLIKELNTGELVNPVARESSINLALCKAAEFVYSTAGKITPLELAAVDDHYIGLVSGGNNGSPRWDQYLNQLAHFMHYFTEQGLKCWLVRLDNDCPDDVWYAYIGFRKQQA